MDRCLVSLWFSTCRRAIPPADCETWLRRAEQAAGGCFVFAANHEANPGAPIDILSVSPGR